jgi:hypothetical protein
MTMFTVISDEGATEIDASVDGERVLVAPAALSAAIGWQLKPEGLCRGEVCVPLFGKLEADAEGQVDLVEAAALLRRPTLLDALLDAEAAALVVGVSAEDRRSALTDLRLPTFSLPDLDGVLHASDGWPGKKKLLVAFASW